MKDQGQIDEINANFFSFLIKIIFNSSQNIIVGQKGINSFILFSFLERNVIRIVKSWQPQSYLVSKNFHVQLYLDICSQRRLAQSHPQDDIACQIGILA